MTDAFRRAEIPGVGALDGIETHDCFSMTEYMAIDHFGITEPGESWKAVEDGELERDGAIPVNPSGGLIGVGHPVGATGVRMLLDAARQVTGQAGEYQVEGARTFATLNIGGSLTTDGQLRRRTPEEELTMADVEVYGKMLSTLPDDDDHPYRTGAWRPQTVEYDADDLDVVEGETARRPRRRVPAQHREPAAPGDRQATTRSTATA